VVYLVISLFKIAGYTHLTVGGSAKAKTRLYWATNRSTLYKTAIELDEQRYLK
jgi:hypothetical protein